jgi:hypothetical protein
MEPTLESIARAPPPPQRPIQRTSTLALSRLSGLVLAPHGLALLALALLFALAFGPSPLALFGFALPFTGLTLLRLALPLALFGFALPFTGLTLLRLALPLALFGLALAVAGLALLPLTLFGLALAVAGLALRCLALPLALLGLSLAFAGLALFLAVLALPVLRPFARFALLFLLRLARFTLLFLLSRACFALLLRRLATLLGLSFPSVFVRFATSHRLSFASLRCGIRASLAALLRPPCRLALPLRTELSGFSSAFGLVARSRSRGFGALGLSSPVGLPLATLAQRRVASLRVSLQLTAACIVATLRGRCCAIDAALGRRRNDARRSLAGGAPVDVHPSDWAALVAPLAASSPSIGARRHPHPRVVTAVIANVLPVLAMDDDARNDIVMDDDPVGRIPGGRVIPPAIVITVTIVVIVDVIHRLVIIAHDPDVGADRDERRGLIERNRQPHICVAAGTHGATRARQCERHDRTAKQDGGQRRHGILLSGISRMGHLLATQPPCRAPGPALAVAGLHAS